MLLWWLWACSPCGTDPASLVVTDPDGVASEADLAYAAQGLAEFVGWTARDAICVRDIAFTDVIDPSDSYDARVDPIGAYDRRGRVLLEPGHDVFTRFAVRHELCHALDRGEGIVEAHPGVFSGGRDEADYPESLREAEAFADACEAGPSLELEAAIAAACGGAYERSDAEAVLDDVVFTGHDPDAPLFAPFPVGRVEVSVGDGFAVDRAGGGYGGVLVRAVGPGEATHVFVLDGDGVATLAVDTGFAGPEAVHVAPWNHGVAIATPDGGAVIAGDGTRTDAPGIDTTTMLVWDDVVFAADARGHLVARDLSGATIDLGLHDDVYAATDGALAAHPGDGEVLLQHAVGLWAGTPDGGWRWVDAPPYTLPTDGVRVGAYDLTAYGGSANVPIGWADSGVVLPDDPCATWPGALTAVDGAPTRIDFEWGADRVGYGPVSVW